MPGGVAGGIDGAYAGHQLVLGGLDLPLVVASEVVAEVGVVGLGLGRFQLGSVHMHLGAADFAQAAGMVEMQVAEEHQVDVRRGQAQPGKVRRQALLLAHLRRAHGEAAVPALTQERVGDLLVVAADVVEDAPVFGLDQVGEDWRFDQLPVAALPGGDRLVIAVGGGQQRPEFGDLGHGASFHSASRR